MAPGRPRISQNFPVSPNPYPDRPSIDWRAIALGATVAIAVSTVLAALGVALIVALADNGMSAISVAGPWALGAAGLGFAAGGYVAGRLRADISQTPRDGTLGLAVWALGVFGLAVLLAVLENPLAARGTPRGERIATMVDALFRPLPVAPAEVAGASAQGSTMAAQGGTRAYDPGNIAAERSEVGRILRYGTVRGQLSADDRAHVGRLISMNSDLTQGEAERRVDKVLAEAAREVEDTRAKAGAMTAWLAIAVMLAAAAAVWAARLGGRHRPAD